MQITAEFLDAEIGSAERLAQRLTAEAEQVRGAVHVLKQLRERLDLPEPKTTGESNG